MTTPSMHRSRCSAWHGAARAAAAALVFAGLALPLACESEETDGRIGELYEPSGTVDERTAPGGISDAAPTTEAPRDAATPPLLVAARAAQESRLRRLRFLESAGTVELRWKDSDGAHFEQCDLRLFAVLPSKTAFQLSKLGDRFAWIGSDEEHWWVYQAKAKPHTVLEVRPWNDDRDAGLSVLSPRSLLTLAGLAPLPSDPATTVQEVAKTVVIEAPSRDREPGVRWTLDRVTFLPIEVALFDANGGVIASGTLSDYKSAAIDGAPPGDFPQVPGRINVARTDGSGDVRFALDAPSGRAAKVKPQLFDLVHLQETLRPDDVRYVTPSVEPTAPPASPASH